MNLLHHAVFAARDKKRLAEIGAVLARFGLSELLRRFKLTGLLPLPKSAAAAHVHGLTLPQRVCAAFEELGPAFVKLGQILAVRSDLLPPEWTVAFAKLHSGVAPVAWEVIRKQVEEDLGMEAADAFAAFDTEPVAAGSIAQIYRARLRGTDTDVAVKVQRPAIAPVIEADMRILHHLAATAEHHAPELGWLRLPEIIRALADALREELDFTREGQNAERIAANFAKQPDIHIPQVYWALSGPRLLVQDYIDGSRPENPATLIQAGLDPKRLAARGADAVLQMAFIDGLFHADPHPGNILCLPENHIAFLDFGIVGQVTPRRRDELMGLIDGIVREQPSRVRDVLLAWSGAEVTDLAKLENDVSRFVARYRLPPLDFSRAIGDFLGIAREHRLNLPYDLVLLLKALVTAEGCARTLDPEIDLIAHAAPLARRLLAQSLSPESLKEMAGLLLMETRILQAELPAALRGLIRMLQRGRIPLEVKIHGLDAHTSSADHAARRLAFALVAGALALGLAPRLIAQEEVWFGFPVLTLLMLLVALGIAALPRKKR